VSYNIIIRMSDISARLAIILFLSGSAIVFGAFLLHKALSCYH